MKKQEKLVVISGGAGGIGRSAALKLGELEYYPILLDRDEDAGKTASAELEAAALETMPLRHAVGNFRWGMR